MKSAALLSFALAVAAASTAAQADRSAPPARLSETGLYRPGSTNAVGDSVIAFAPQYPLWSDGTRKLRWIWLPPGSAIDASQVDAWEFPVGTRLWKEFGYGTRVETRMIERLADGSWRFAAYIWNRAGTDADLAPEDGAFVAVSDAPNGRYAVPARNDCLACHEGSAVPVLGFSALQLSADRDPMAPHADTKPGQLDLKQLAARGLLRGLAPQFLATAPRIDAPTPLARAALGYLHGNCGHCHNEAGALTGLEMVLAQRADRAANSAERTLQSLLGHSSRFRPEGAQAAQRIAAGHGSSVLTLRMKTDNPLARMPPLGVQVVDTEGVQLIERWISNDLQASLINR